MFALARDIDTIDEASLTSRLKEAVALQIFSDGGFTHAQGAAAFVITCVSKNGSSTLLGTRGIWMEEAKSAFHAEVQALEAATEYVERLRQRMRAQIMN